MRQEKSGHAGANTRAPDRLHRLGDLYDTHHRRLWNLARRMSRSGDEALDLVQEAFLRAARRPDDIPPEPAGAEAWLVRIVVNLCLDRWRRNRRRRELLPPAPWEAAAFAPTRESSIESALAARGEIEAALATLPPRQRAVIVLHELEERDTAEIARLLGLAQVTVRWYLASGRAMLRRHLTAAPAAETRPQTKEAKP